jgi:hypothetical protein
MNRLSTVILLVFVLVAPSFAKENPAGGSPASAKPAPGAAPASSGTAGAGATTAAPTPPGTASPPKPEETVQRPAKIAWMKSDGSQISIDKTNETIDVTDAVFRDRLKEMGIGSTISMKVVTTGDKRTLQTLEVPSIDSPVPMRIVMIVGTLAVLFLLAGLAWGWISREKNQGQGDRFRPLDTFLGKDSLYSSSKFQAAVWFALLIATYVPAFLLRWLNAGIFGGLSIPSNLFMMSGLSVVTFAGAKAMKQTQMSSVSTEAQDAIHRAAGAAAAEGSLVTQMSQAAPADQAAMAPLVADAHAAAVVANSEAVAKQVTASKIGSPARTNSLWFDLTHNDDGTPSLAKFQLVVIVLLAVVLYAIQAWDFLGAIPMQANVSLPDVDKALLTAFGLGHGAYLGVKFAGDGQ